MDGGAGTMPKMDWRLLSKESKQKFGAYGEYYAKMEFASYGLDVFTSEVDDHGIDFVVKVNSRYYAIQVKSLQADTGYVFMKERHFDIADKGLYLCLLIFEQGQLPDLYLIPAFDWNQENDLLKYHKYDKPGQTSEPEYGVNISKKNMHLLDKYKFDNKISELLK